MKKTYTLLFMLLAIIFTATRLSKHYPSFLPPSWFMKILPLLILVLFTKKISKTTPLKIFTWGLLFSVLGDFFLDYDPVNWFVFGLGSFLIAHILYILSLTPISLLTAKKRSFIIAIYLIYGVSIFALISSDLGELYIPVLAYMSILLIMALTTLTSNKTNKWLIIGGLSFVISDSLLGINKFYNPIPHAQLLIMLSYYFAQYALVQGMFLAYKKQQQ
jgi:uncharacterized membrane protein YhhN